MFPLTQGPNTPLQSLTVINKFGGYSHEQESITSLAKQASVPKAPISLRSIRVLWSLIHFKLLWVGCKGALCQNLLLKPDTLHDTVVHVPK